MAETKQIAFDLRELATALIKQHGIHEGTWIAGFEFNFTAGNIGITTDDAKPAAIAQVNKALLIKQEPGHPAALVVDAAKVNPAPQGQKKKLAAS